MTTGCDPRSSNAERQPSRQLAKSLSIVTAIFFSQGAGGDPDSLSGTNPDEATDSRTLSQRHRVGRRHLRRGSCSPTLFPQTGVVSGRKRGGLSVGDDSQPANRLQSSGKPASRRSPSENHPTRHAIREAAWLTRRCDCATFREKTAVAQPRIRVVSATIPHYS